MMTGGIWLFYDVRGALLQGGQNVRIVRIFYFVTLKLYGLYGFFSNCTDCTDFYPGNTPGFFIFTHFSKFFMKISKKNLVKMKLV